jgi:hypothetical protein
LLLKNPWLFSVSSCIGLSGGLLPVAYPWIGDCFPGKGFLSVERLACSLLWESVGRMPEFSLRILPLLLAA